MKHCPSPPQDFDEYDLPRIVNDYNYFARNYISSGYLSPVVDIQGFVRNMSTSEIVSDLDTINSLEHEFEKIESQYPRLRKHISFTSYYELLIDRIANVNNKTNENSMKTKFTVLYTAVKSRLFAIAREKNYVAVANVKGYIKSIKEKMSDLKAFKSKEHIQNLRDEFETKLNNKITKAQEMINGTIMPFIDKTIKDTQTGVQEMLAELRKDMELAKVEAKKAKENEATLRKRAIFNSILGPLQLAGTALSMLGPQGAIASAGISVVTNLGSAILDKTLTVHKIEIPAKLKKERVLKIAKNAKKHFDDFDEQFKQLKRILKSLNDTDATELEKSNTKSWEDMKHLSEKIQSFKNTTNDNHLPTKEQLESFKKGISGMSDYVRSLCENKKVKSNTSLSKELSALKYGIAFGSEAMETVNSISQDWDKVDDAEAITKQVEQQINLMKLQEMNILEVMMPQLQKVMDSAQSTAKNGAERDHIELDVARWSIQNTLGDVKHQFDEMSKGFEANEDLNICIEKINNAITTVIEVQNEVDSYRDTKQLADLIINVSSISNANTNPYMKLITKNLIIEQYEMAMKAIKSHMFPFVDEFMENSDFVYGLKDENFTAKIEEKIANLILELETKDALITSDKNHMISPTDFIFDDAFFGWDRLTFKNEIEDLFNGHEVTFNADIKGGSKHSAIKFSKIWLRFILNDKEKENEFNDKLLKFRFTMKMVSNNYYRCENRIYYTPLEKPIDFFFEMNNTNPSDLIRPSGIYYDLDDKQFFLSPYTMWNISLHSNEANGFEGLHSFLNDVSKILLEGTARFLEYADDQYTSETCTEKLDQYYCFDGISYIRK